MPSLLHASGRFDESPSWLRRDLARWRDLASVITLTEVADGKRKDALHESGWTLTSGKGEGPGECAILHDRRKWRRRAKYVVKITDGGGTGRLHAPLYATTAVLQRRGTGRMLIVSSTHMPAHVETLLRLGRKAQPATTWRRAANVWAEHIAAARGAYPEADVWVVADFNVDARRDWVRRTVRDAFLTAGADLQVVHTDTGTHGDRRIDFGLSTLPLSRTATHAAEASDHLAALFRTRWPIKR